MSWKPQVQVTGEGNRWMSNQLRFATKEEAEANAQNLAFRWMLVTNHRAIESDEPVNYRWDRTHGRLIPIAEVTS